MATKRAQSKSSNLFEVGVERVEEVITQLGDDFEQLQKRADKRRREFEKNAERRIKKFRTDLRKNEWVKRVEKQRKQIEKRADRFRKDTEQVIEGRVDSVLETMRIASQSEVNKLERMVKALQRKVRELEQGAA